MAKIIGNTTATPNPRPDWAQTDSTKADYIRNKPTILTEEQIKGMIDELGGDTQVQADWTQTDDAQKDYIKNKPILGGLASKDVIEKNDLSQEVQDALNDTTETDPTVPDWAKEPTKPTYTADEVGAIAYTAQALTEEQKAQARSNIGAGTNSFSGNYDDLANKPVLGKLASKSTVEKTDLASDIQLLTEDDVKQIAEENSVSGTWDHIITTEEEFTNLGGLSGRVLVKSWGGSYFADTIDINISNITLLEFEGVFSEPSGSITDDSGKATVRGGLFWTSDYTNDFTFRGFNRVENVRQTGRAGFLRLEDCRNITDCIFSNATNCHHITNCIVDAMDAAYLENCTFINGLEAGENLGDCVYLSDCQYISHTGVNIIIDDSNRYVDVLTCNYVSGLMDEEISAVPVADGFGTLILKEIYDKDEIDELLGNQPVGIWDHIITTEEEFDNLGQLSGRVLVKDIRVFTRNHDVEIGDSLELEFEGSFEFEGDFEVCISGADMSSIRGGTFGIYEGLLTLKNFNKVEDMHITDDSDGGTFALENCSNITRCTFSKAESCHHITDCVLSWHNSETDAHLENCTFIDGIERDDRIANSGMLLNCSHISRIGRYIEIDNTNKYVDGDTCDGYYTEEDIGKIKVITNDGTLQTVEQSVSPLAIGEGNQSIQHKDTSAKAYGNRSVAFNQAVAGAKGYRYCAIDTINKRIYLTADNAITNADIIVIDATDGGTANQTIAPDTSIDITQHYAKNDRFTLKMRGYDLDNAGVIKEIYSNYIVYDDTFVQALENTRLAASKKSTPKTLTQELTTADSYIDRYSFSVPKKPSNGVLIVSEDAFATGTDGTSATGRYSFAAGRNNQAVGDTAAAFGRGNVAGYQSFVAGESSYANDRNYTMAYGSINDGNFTLITGQNNSSDKAGHRGFAAGSGNKLRHDHCTVLGENNYTTAPYQTLIGRAALTTDYDKEAYNIIFGVGNGFTRVKNDDGTIIDTKLGSRRNAFSVWVDGRATIGAEPVKDMDVVNKGYVDNCIVSVDTALDELNGRITESNAANKTYIDNLKLPQLTYGSITDDEGNVTNYISSIQQTGSTAASYGSTALVGGKTSANHSFAVGINAEASGQWSTAFGYGAKAKTSHSVAIGLGTQTAEYVDSTHQNREQFVIGRYNEILSGASGSNTPDGARFIVGIGTGENTYNDDGSIKKKNRNNGLVVWGDGRVEVGKLSVGVGNTVTGSNSLALGTGNTASAAQSFAQGQACTASGQWCVALNHGTTATGRDQTVVGRFNEVISGPPSYGDKTSGALFIVGNGNGDGANRSNGFVSWNDGRATIGKAPENAMDVANKGYVDTSIASLVDSAPETLNTLNELATAINNHEDAYGALLETVGNKVDKVEGKDLSTNDFTDTYKTTLDDIIAGGGASSEEYVPKAMYDALLDIIPYSVGLEYRLRGDLFNVIEYEVSGVGMNTDTNLRIPTQYKSIDITRVGNKAFSGCSSLTSVTIPEGITDFGDLAFTDCINLTSVRLPGSLSGTGGATFRDCTNLTSVIMSEGVQYIGTQSFEGCIGLTQLRFPSSIVIVNSRAFYGCTAMQVYDFSACTRIPTLNAQTAFTGISSTCQIRVPASLADAWKAATNWSAYADYIVGV